jgi:hypothetical protein
VAGVDLADGQAVVVVVVDLEDSEVVVLVVEEPEVAGKIFFQSK